MARIRLINWKGRFGEYTVVFKAGESFYTYRMDGALFYDVLYMAETRHSPGKAMNMAKKYAELVQPVSVPPPADNPEMYQPILL